MRRLINRIFINYYEYQKDHENPDLDCGHRAPDNQRSVASVRCHKPCNAPHWITTSPRKRIGMSEASSAEVNRVGRQVDSVSRDVDWVSREVKLVNKAVANVLNKMSHVETEVGQVYSKVENLDSHQRTIAGQISQLATQFQKFVTADQLGKNLQLAETRVVKLRQEVDGKYGHYREVRRRTTGILQAIDAGIVTHETIQHTTEDVMMNSPGYWLSAALVALAAWIRDDLNVAQQAMREALRRDDARTALFFGLVLRRYQREAASSQWISRYFERQDPTNLPRKTMVLLDAITNGGFGPAARELSMRSLQQWLDQLSANPNFVDQQRQRWVDSLRGLQPVIPDLPYLSRYSPNHGQLKALLESSSLNCRVRDFFSGVFEGKLAMSPHLTEQVDAILESLVTNYDDEELPLRKQERECELIVQCNGDMDLARSRLNSESASFDTSISFADLLTNAAMNAEQSGASLATQRFAIAMSREWISQAYDQIVAEGRQGVPNSIELDIDGWMCETDGWNEEQIVGLLESECEERAQHASDACTLEPAFYLSATVGGLAVLTILMMLYQRANEWLVLFAFAGIGALSYAVIQYRRLDSRKANARKSVEQDYRKKREVLRACIAEFVDWKEEWADRDNEASEARAALDSITARDHLTFHNSDARGVLDP